MRKAVSGIMLTLFLIGALTLAFNIQTVKAEEPAVNPVTGSSDTNANEIEPLTVVESGSLVNFDDIPLSPETYQQILIYVGITWDSGLLDFSGEYNGGWYVYNSLSYAIPVSPPNYAFNGYGAINPGFNFTSQVNFKGAYFMTTANANNPSAVRFVGYVSGVPTYYSEWLSLSSIPTYLSANFPGVDRVVVEMLGSGWFAMDDLNYIVPPPPPVGGIVTATFSGGSDDAIFGVRPDATDNFDYVYDIPEPPAPLEPPHVRAYFYYPGQTPDELHRSSLAPEDLMEWPLRIEYADNIENVTLTWRVENVPTEYNVLLYREGDLLANMRVEDNYTFEASTGSYDFRIVVGELLPFTLELTRGWNMISFPVLPENSSPDAIFDGYYVLYRWDAEDKRYMPHADSGSFIEPDPDVEPSVGYWAYVLEDENVDLLGVPVYQLNLSLSQGWNLIGPPYGGSSIADLADDPDISVLPHAFTWNAREKSYSMTQLLEAGKGYWVYALQPSQPPYPAIVATLAKVGDNEIRINVLTGSIPALEWAYSVSSTEGSYWWIVGTSKLDPPYVSLGTYASGTYYVSLKHVDTGHFYFWDQTITIS